MCNEKKFLISNLATNCLNYIFRIIYILSREDHKRAELREKYSFRGTLDAKYANYT
jgi:hypothetical protein